MAAGSQRAEVRLYGVRHHGPGSARQVLAGLDEFAPTHVLIEAPGEASDWLMTLADQAVKPPVALLGYIDDAPRFSAFWPFEVYSPEYQAALWAHENSAELRAIDLPAAMTLGAQQIAHNRMMAQLGAEKEEEEGQDEVHEQSHIVHTAHLATLARMDPIGTLAQLGGYEDGEDWWAMLIEDNPDPGDSFAAIADAMTSLRQLVDAQNDASEGSVYDDRMIVNAKSDERRSREAMREAFMRLEIARAVKEAGTGGRIAVICGAWHVPALEAKVKASDDRAQLKGVIKAKTAFTLVPWSASRMTRSSGYGAGVRLPLWNRAVWTTQSLDMPSYWLGNVANSMRKTGELVSTAAVIEANRTARALAQLRGRPMPGLGEYREAGISTMCFGSALKWDLAMAEMVKAEHLGEVPSSVDKPPILKDLELQQKRTRLQPEKLARSLAIDLRTDIGNRRSALLHRLRVLGVHWGIELGRRGSHGTFRENWTLEWKPGLEVDLLDKLHFGSTIEAAACALLTEQMGDESQASQVADVTMNALAAYLPTLVDVAVERLELLSARSTDAIDLATTVERLVWLVKMGQARTTPLVGLPPLVERLVVRLCLNLPGEVRSLDDEAAKQYAGAVNRAHSALGMADLPPQLLERWHQTIAKVALDDDVNARVAGHCLRLAKSLDNLTLNQVMTTLNRRLSPVFLAEERAEFFAGFFEGQGTMLMFDADLRQAIQDWFMALGEDEFVERLPLLRRAFSDLQPIERKQLLQTILEGVAQSAVGDWTPANIPHWDRIQDQVLTLMRTGAGEGTGV